MTEGHSQVHTSRDWPPPFPSLWVGLRLGAMCALVKGYHRLTRASGAHKGFTKCWVCPLVFTLLSFLPEEGDQSPCIHWKWNSPSRSRHSGAKMFIVHSGYTMNVHMTECNDLLSNNAQDQSSAQTFVHLTQKSSKIDLLGQRLLPDPAKKCRIQLGEEGGMPESCWLSLPGWPETQSLWRPEVSFHIIPVWKGFKRPGKISTFALSNDL